MNYLITGSAGFIGFHTARKLLEQKHVVIGIDNLNKYYNPKLKDSRNDILKKYKNYKFYKININNKNQLNKVFFKEKIDIVIHLAAQAGVRYSIENPETYIKTNLVGFFNILRNCSQHRIKKFIFASSSSIYGSNKSRQYKENLKTDNPLQLYAATKKSNELMAYSYSCLFNLKCIGLRFFTVYGPWGRPDMSLFRFVESILKNKFIEIYNKGNHYRDFTYIDDCISGILKITNIKMKRNFEVFNIASGKPIKLLKFIEIIEKKLGINAKKKYLGLQKGDSIGTFASIKKISTLTKYKPMVSIEEGISIFVNWYKSFYK